jgi:hypothetical protein
MLAELIEQKDFDIQLINIIRSKYGFKTIDEKFEETIFNESNVICIKEEITTSDLYPTENLELDEYLDGEEIKSPDQASDSDSEYIPDKAEDDDQDINEEIVKSNDTNQCGKSEEENIFE